MGREEERTAELAEKRVNRNELKKIAIALCELLNDKQAFADGFPVFSKWEVYQRQPSDGEDYMLDHIQVKDNMGRIINLSVNGYQHKGKCHCYISKVKQRVFNERTLGFENQEYPYSDFNSCDRNATLSKGADQCARDFYRNLIRENAMGEWEKGFAAFERIEENVKQTLAYAAPFREFISQAKRERGDDDNKETYQPNLLKFENGCTSGLELSLDLFSEQPSTRSITIGNDTTTLHISLSNDEALAVLKFLRKRNGKS